MQRARQGGFSPKQALPLLGELIMHDETLSVNRNQACAACHTLIAGLVGGVSVLNRENVAFPGSIDGRSNKRKPMSHAYAPFAPVLHYRASTGDLVGGNFWDDHATGLITGNPAWRPGARPAAGPYRDGLVRSGLRRLPHLPRAVPGIVPGGLGRPGVRYYLADRHRSALRHPALQQFDEPDDP